MKIKAGKFYKTVCGHKVGPMQRWDTPLWKDAEATGRIINRLRAALKGDQT